ncbi:MAG TPA: hypothetical protein VEX68_19900 [Bryobacteraceae bacterium]|nr:hypothetical protein [Bryobacteraceae bacterium]
MLAALQEAVTRQHKTLDEMASEAVMNGIKTGQLDRVRAHLAKGHRHGAASGIPANPVKAVIEADRKRRRRTQ